ncbi:MAG: GGDEF domain-containing protein [Clostridia bacterium]
MNKRKGYAISCATIVFFVMILLFENYICKLKLSAYVPSNILTSMSLITGITIIVLLVVVFLNYLIIKNFFLKDLLYDTLTKAFNREKLRADLKKFVKKEKEFKVVYIDFNDFKKINDTYKHDAGDYILKFFVKNALKHGLKIYRMGGDEFIVLSTLKNIGKILDELNNLNVLYYDDRANKETLIPFSFSYGIEKWDGKKLVDEILRSADEKMFYQKEKGKNKD